MINGRRVNPITAAAVKQVRFDVMHVLLQHTVQYMPVNYGVMAYNLI